MRPSDENQDNRMHPHMRPNLMSSSRRGGIEDSILAKLEREPSRRSDSGNGLRLAWYGAAVVVAVGLTGVLAWLAAGTGQAPIEMAQLETPRPVLAEPLPAPEPIKTAVIVDSPPEPLSAPIAAPIAAPVAAPAPPLRMLEPEQARPVPAKAPPPPVKAAPPRRPEPRAAAPARARAAAARPATRQTARPARTVNPARPEQNDDSDVALISAVIYHANGHAAPEDGEASSGPCADDACRARPAR